MNKNKKQLPVKAINNPAPVKKSIHFASPVKLTVLFALVAMLTLYFHEMWRDEYQAWLISSSSASLSDLFTNIRYEGHPCTWYLILFTASKISSNVILMQVIHLGIAVSTAYLIFKYTPFKALEKILLVLGYFFIYEYCVISRNYAISILLITLLCISFQRSRRRGIIEGILLFALCNTNIYGAFIAGVFSLYILTRMFENRKDRSYIVSSLVTSAFITAGFLVLYLQVRPASLVHYNEYYKWNRGFNWDHTWDTMAKLFDVYFPVPTLEVNGSFGKNIVTGLPFLKSIVAFAAVVIICIILKKNRALLIMYAAGTAGILTLLYFNTHTSLRHEGFLFMLLVIVMWFFRNTIHSPVNSTSRTNRLFLFILIIQFIGGLIAVGKEIVYPFSNLREAGRYVIKNKFDKEDISGIPDYIISPISAFTHMPVYAAETGTQINFISWNDERQENNDAFGKIIMRADSLVKNGMPKAIFILNVGLVDSLQQPVESFPINDSTEVTFARKFDKPSMISDEKYFFYEVRKREE